MGRVFIVCVCVVLLVSIWYPGNVCDDTGGEEIFVWLGIELHCGGTVFARLVYREIYVTERLEVRRGRERWGRRCGTRRLRANGHTSHLVSIYYYCVYVTRYEFAIH